MAADKRTILDRWDEGGYTGAWEVDFDVYDPTDAEFIQEVAPAAPAAPAAK